MFRHAKWSAWGVLSIKRVRIPNIFSKYSWLWTWRISWLRTIKISYFGSIQNACSHKTKEIFVFRILFCYLESRNRENSSSASFWGSKLENPSSGSKVTSILVRSKSKKKRFDFTAGELFYHNGDHMQFSRAKNGDVSSKIRDISKGKSMEIDFRDFQFALISLWKCSGFLEKFYTFLLSKIIYLLDK